MELYYLPINVSFIIEQTLCSDITLSNSIFHSEITGDLVHVNYGTSTIDSCTFMGNDMPDTDGIDFDGVEDGVISNSFIQGFFGFNSDAIDLGEECTNILIENCFINDISDKGISIGQYSAAIINNNTIVNCNLGVGIKDKGDAVINHLTSYSNATAVSVFQKNPGAGGGEVSISNSILSNSSAAPLYMDSFSSAETASNFYDTGTMPGSTDEWMNPLFENPTNYDFHLLPESPAIDVGLDGEDLGTLNHQFTAKPKIMISDIQYFHPVEPDKEFIKIYNPGPDTIDISGYSISQGIEFVFPAGSTIHMNEKITLVRDISLFPNITGIVYEWTSGKLANEGEMIILADSNGIIIDHVDYSPETPWPVYQAVDEYISLISPNLDNHFGMSWFVEVPVQVASINKNTNSISVFPNPASNHISFITDRPLENVQIFDLTGRLLIEHNSKTNPGSIDISALKSGVYISIINSIERLKFVKQ